MVLSWVPGSASTKPSKRELFEVLADHAGAGRGGCAIRRRRQRAGDRRIDQPRSTWRSRCSVSDLDGPAAQAWPLIYRLPGFSFIRLSSRFMLLAMVGFAALSGLGFSTRVAGVAALRRAAG
jgi:hypothetical protein